MLDAIVIGAGIAGLTAARVLSLESMKVCVLEARDRPGGRIHTVKMPESNTGREQFNPSREAPPDDVNHDSISVFAAPNTLPSSNDDAPFGTNDDNQESSVDVDLGANYLIGCSNRPSDQPLFHMARMLKVETVISLGDLLKKYRGWECIELATWRDRSGNLIPLEAVTEVVFLFDRVVHLMLHKYKMCQARREASNQHRIRFRRCRRADGPTLPSDPSGRPYSTLPSVEFLFEAALREILQAEARHNIRPKPAFRTDSFEEKNVFRSITARYLTYVNPIHRLPHSSLIELGAISGQDTTCKRELVQCRQSDKQLCGEGDEFVNPRENRYLDKVICPIADQLVTTYPSPDQRQTFLDWVNKKTDMVASRNASTEPEIAQSVKVAWEDRLVTSRFADLIEPLTRNVPIVYGWVVKRIEWGVVVDAGAEGREVKGVRVTVNRRRGLVSNQTAGGEGAESQVFTAKHCIVTVPVGVLADLSPISTIAFEPSLPRAKRDAISRLAPPLSGSATHEKVILRFRNPDDIFWDVNAVHLKSPDARLHILNLHRYGKSGVLCAHIWGGSGIRISSMTDFDVVQSILVLLNEMYPQARHPINGFPQPVSYLVTRWSSDPFALGAYTTGEPESTDADRVEYARTLTGRDADGQAPSPRLPSPPCLPSSSTNIGDHNDSRQDDSSGQAASDSAEPSSISDQQEDIFSPSSCPLLLFAGEGTLTAEEAKECTHGALKSGFDRAWQVVRYFTIAKLLSEARQSARPLPPLFNSSAADVDDSQLRNTFLALLSKRHELASKRIALYLLNRLNNKPSLSIDSPCLRTRFINRTGSSSPSSQANPTAGGVSRGTVDQVPPRRSPPRRRTPRNKRRRASSPILVGPAKQRRRVISPRSDALFVAGNDGITYHVTCPRLDLQRCDTARLDNDELSSTTTDTDVDDCSFMTLSVDLSHSSSFDYADLIDQTKHITTVLTSPTTDLEVDDYSPMPVNSSRASSVDHINAIVPMNQITTVVSTNELSATTTGFDHYSHVSAVNMGSYSVDHTNFIDQINHLTTTALPAANTGLEVDNYSPMPVNNSRASSVDHTNSIVPMNQLAAASTNELSGTTTDLDDNPLASLPVVQINHPFTTTELPATTPEPGICDYSFVTISTDNSRASSVDHTTSIVPMNQTTTASTNDLPATTIGLDDNSHIPVNNSSSLSFDYANLIGQIRHTTAELPAATIGLGIAFCSRASGDSIGSQTVDYVNLINQLNQSTIESPTMITGFDGNSHASLPCSQINHTTTELPSTVADLEVNDYSHASADIGSYPVDYANLIGQANHDTTELNATVADLEVDAYSHASVDNVGSSSVDYTNVFELIRSQMTNWFQPHLSSTNQYADQLRSQWPQLSWRERREIFDKLMELIESLGISRHQPQSHQFDNDFG